MSRRFFLSSGSFVVVLAACAAPASDDEGEDAADTSASAFSEREASSKGLGSSKAPPVRRGCDAVDAVVVAFGATKCANEGDTCQTSWSCAHAPNGDACKPENASQDGICKKTPPSTVLHCSEPATPKKKCVKA